MSLQESYDNAGLLVGNPEADVDSALICVDITEAVMDEAIECGAGLVIAHHHVIFYPLRHIPGGPTQSVWLPGPYATESCYEPVIRTRTVPPTA